MMGLPPCHNMAMLAGGLSPLPPPYQPASPRTHLKVLHIFSMAATPPVAMQHLIPPIAPPHLPLPLHAPPPKFHKTHCLSTPCSIIPDVLDELGELPIAAHCHCDEFYHTYVNILGNSEFIPLVP